MQIPQLPDFYNNENTHSIYNPNMIEINNLHSIIEVEPINTLKYIEDLVKGDLLVENQIDQNFFEDN